jgi:hypothetical protein
VRRQDRGHFEGWNRPERLADLGVRRRSSPSRWAGLALCVPRNILMRSKSISTSWYIYLSLILVLVGILVLFQFIPLSAVLKAQTSAFTWPFLVIIVLLGGAGTWAASKTGFPDSLDPSISNKQRLLFPVLWGLGLGVVALAIEQFQPLGPIDAPFPISLPFYLYGAIVSEILLRLFLLPVPLWLISSLLLGGRWQMPIFWGLAVLTSIVEPVMVLGGLDELGILSTGVPVGIWVFIAFAYGVNLFLAYEYRKNGFIAPLVLRISFYMPWHILF